MNAKGFTLVEIIAALVIGGIILAAAGMGVVKVTEGLVFTQKNAATAIKAQITLNRIEKELHIATNISSASLSSLTFTNNKGGGTATYTLCRNGNHINLVDLGTGSTCDDGDSLIDNVTALTFAYLESNGTTEASPLEAAKIIEVAFTLSGAAGITSSFTMRVNSMNL